MVGSHFFASINDNAKIAPTQMKEAAISSMDGFTNSTSFSFAAWSFSFLIRVFLSPVQDGILLPIPFRIAAITMQIVFASVRIANATE